MLIYTHQDRVWESDNHTHKLTQPQRKRYKWKYESKNVYLYTDM